jgi:2-oxoglutarate ferredoxin oxidoreductase subunit gamma
MANYQLRFSGTGGQGIMMIGDLMAYYYGLIEDKQIVLLKSYGPEARGGACRSELIVDENECYPAITRVDFLLAMSQQAYDLYTEDADEKTLILIDEELVRKTDDHFPMTHRLPLTEIAKQKTGRIVCANIVALGAMTRLLNIDHDAMLKVLKEKLPQKILDINLIAYEEGYRALGEAE